MWVNVLRKNKVWKGHTNVPKAIPSFSKLLLTLHHVSEKLYMYFVCHMTAGPTKEKSRNARWDVTV